MAPLWQQKIEEIDEIEQLYKAVMGQKGKTEILDAAAGIARALADKMGKTERQRWIDHLRKIEADQ